MAIDAIKQRVLIKIRGKMYHSEKSSTTRNTKQRPKSVQPNTFNLTNKNKKKQSSSSSTMFKIHLCLAFTLSCIIYLVFIMNYNYYNKASSSIVDSTTMSSNSNSYNMVDKTPNSQGNTNNIRDTKNAAISNNKEASTTIAYAISITSCPNSTKDQKITDGAAILQHSIHLSSSQNNNDPTSSTSKYNYQMIAIVHPSAMSCAQELSQLGYIIKERDTPIDVNKIESDVLRRGIVKTGCCQEKELIKLWAYTLTDYPIVVHLDLDTLLLQPMDELYDAMLYGPSTTSSQEGIPVMFNKTLPKDGPINAYFTRDYNMALPGKEHVGVQGGFFIIKPNQSVFQEYIHTIYASTFGAGSGWGRKGFGGYYGAQQIQGLLPYYYDFLHPKEAVELNRCFYNAMGDNPRLKTEDGSLGKCKDTATYECDDCRDTPFHKIKLVHFTLCQKPWMCRYCVLQKKWREYCNNMHHSWYKVRKSLEDGWVERFSSTYKSRSTVGKYRVDHFYGFCRSAGIRGYVPLRLPKELGISTS